MVLEKVVKLGQLSTISHNPLQRNDSDLNVLCHLIFALLATTDLEPEVRRVLANHRTGLNEGVEQTFVSRLNH